MTQFFMSVNDHCIRCKKPLPIDIPSECCGLKYNHGLQKHKGKE